EKDTHLKFIRDYLLEDNKKVRKTLKTYRSVLKNKEIPYDEQSPVHSRLKLAGVVRAENGKLSIRNRVYQEVFDREWIEENTPRDIVRIVAYTASSALVAVLVWFFIVQPVFFPKFTKYQNFSWFDRDIYYTDQSGINLDIPMPSEKEIVRITVDGEDISLSGKTDIKKAGISFNNLKIGENYYQICFYSGLWKENFEKKLNIVSYPKKNWKSFEADFVFLQPGTFMMGSPSDELGRNSDETQHQVTLTRGFYVQTTEVTQEQWKAVMGNNPSYFKDCGKKCPVEYVSWNDVQEFIRRLNQMESADRYRLPTEAEWEYAARAGTQTAFANGYITNEKCNDPNLDKIGWYCGNSGNSTHPAAQKQANKWGLYDMHGNVWEWCQDWYNAYSIFAIKDPIGPKSGTAKANRGGSWFYRAGCRAALRSRDYPGYRDNTLGFRLLREAP
ncbi:MAG: formylglycine-generating enzyme family protein, partial [Desulfobacteraceae bacterium]|nr:formylglycine-generating enzyme family protein [Desulfobacteraceae bacterium]